MRDLWFAAGLVPLLAAPAFADTVVVQKGRVFRPAEITVPRGETIVFTNEDSYIHQVYVPGMFESAERAPGENVNQAFTISGTFQVRCRIHPTMKLTVRVR